ncbi:hypothetical protein [Parerythrobacter aestuarii]|uniref:hypothetical protein n=1 Tax=Parerythrobacter aestuarii TaxID=3020909 RepID=UPI0024DE6DB3|nr:hypothetical protein [Parerythrobacter aestuarii]
MMQLLLENRAGMQKICVLLVFLWAMWRGGGPERASGAVLLGMVAVHMAFRDVFGFESVYLTLDPVNFLIDTLGLVAFVLIALKANRFYPMVLAAAQLVSFMGHFVRIMVEPVSSLAYYLLTAMPFWFQIFILAGGMARHVYRNASMGSYRDWRLIAPQLPRSSFG